MSSEGYVPRVNKDAVDACVAYYQELLTGTARYVTQGDNLTNELGIEYKNRFYTWQLITDAIICSDVYSAEYITDPSGSKIEYSVLYIDAGDNQACVFDAEQGLFLRCWTTIEEDVRMGTDGRLFRMSDENGRWTLNVVRPESGFNSYIAIFNGSVGLPPCGIVPYCLHRNGGNTPSYNSRCANDDELPTQMPLPDASNSPNLKSDVSKYATAGIGAATLVFGTVAAVFVIKSIRKSIRSRSEIQIEFVDAPILTRSLISGEPTTS